MPTLRTERTETLGSSVLGSRDVEVLIARVAAAGAVEFDLTNSFRADMLKSVLLVCALSRRPRRIVLHLGAAGVSTGLEDSLWRSLLGPLLWKSGRPSPTESSSDELSAMIPGHTDPERKLFCVSTELLDCAKRETFQADLGRWMVGAGIAIDRAVFERLTALVYEPCANAEEHGSTRLTEAKAMDPRRVFRCIAARVHAEPGSPLSPVAASYLTEFAKWHDERTRWLEVVVADAGMGIAYPAYLSRARRMGSTYADVYVADHAAELGQLDEILNRGLSTKGDWGRVKTAYPDIGKGMRMIGRNIERLRGFGAVRAGRCCATIACPEAEVPESAIGTHEYTVDQTERPLFLGTAWHFLIPLDPQLKLDV